MSNENKIPSLTDSRAAIDHIDRELVKLFCERMQVSADVAEYKRSVGMAYLRAHIRKGHRIEVDIRGKRAKAVIVSTHLKVRTPPCAIPVLA